MAAKKSAASVEAVEETAVVEETAEKVVTVKTKAAAKSEPKFPLAKLRENCVKLYGVSSSTFAGAMYGHEDKEYTIQEVQDIIDEWLHGKGGKK